MFFIFEILVATNVNEVVKCMRMRDGCICKEVYSPIDSQSPFVFQELWTAAQDNDHVLKPYNVFDSAQNEWENQQDGLN